MGQNDVLGIPEKLPSDADNLLVGRDSNADNFKVFVQISRWSMSMRINNIFFLCIQNDDSKADLVYLAEHRKNCFECKYRADTMSEMEQFFDCQSNISVESSWISITPESGSNAESDSQTESSGEAESQHGISVKSLISNILKESVTKKSAFTTTSNFDSLIM